MTAFDAARARSPQRRDAIKRAARAVTLLAIDEQASREARRQNAIVNDVCTHTDAEACAAAAALERLVLETPCAHVAPAPVLPFVDLPPAGFTRSDAPASAPKVRPGQSVTLRATGRWQVVGHHPDGGGRLWLHRRTESGVYETATADVDDVLPVERA